MAKLKIFRKLLHDCSSIILGGYYMPFKMSDRTVFLLMIILVPLAGELKFHPFDNNFSTFQVSFGSPVFLLFLLWLRTVPMPICGLCTGVTVLAFRMFLEYYDNGMTLEESLQLHASNFFYYLSYASFLSLFPLGNRPITRQAIRIAASAIMAEIVASFVELTAINMILYDNSLPPSLDVMARISFIAFLRGFFILSFFFLFQLYLAELTLEHESAEKRRLSLYLADLYAEKFQLKKSLKDSEIITKECYNIYEQMQKEGIQSNLSTEVLRIAGKIHDIKKDNQRIYAGLNSLVTQKEGTDYLTPHQIYRMIEHSQRKYAKELSKDISFSSHIELAIPQLHVYTLLSIFNNLFSNAVEAIKKEGQITLTMTCSLTTLFITLNNTGSYIMPSRIGQLFRPGYTTKFDSDGTASSGIGLTYVHDLTTSLGGKISIESDGKNSVTCCMEIPLASISQNYNTPNDTQDTPDNNGGH